MQKLHFWIDILVSLLFWKLGIHIRRKPHICQVGESTFSIRPFSMDSCIVYETALFGIYDQYLPVSEKKMVIFDIGAHIGDFSIHQIKRFHHATVYGFEPDTENFQAYKINISLNDYLGQINAYNIGIGSKSGVVTLWQEPGNTGGHSVIKQKGQSKPQTIQVMTLANVMRKNHIPHIDIVKMDIEGAEYDIVMSLSPGVMKKISQIILELHSGYDRQKLINHLHVCGFRVDTASGFGASWLLRNLFTVPLLIATRE